MGNNDRESGLIYFLAGAAVGAALGVLLAPRAGRETREQVAEWLKERRSKGEELLQKVKEESQAAAHKARQAYDDLSA